MLPSILARQLEQGIGDYIETTFPMTNEPFRGSLHKMIEAKDPVFHEPYLAVRLPFRQVEADAPGRTVFTAIHPVYRPYVHQENAFKRLCGDGARSTLIATGTGSGKTECFLYPILEYCFKHRGERGVKALIIYPMNALAADQARRIAELIHSSKELRGNVTAGMYVGGQERTPNRAMGESTIITDHETMLNSPPDILLTNYKMLDYLLVRPKDAALWKDNQPMTLKYIAVDELHTFDGAQGTDLACLLRRLKMRLYAPSGYICCIGTSATMGARDNADAIRRYAAEVFGEAFEEDSVVTEDRLSPEEYFADRETTEFKLPTAARARKLEELSLADEEPEYLRLATSCWFDGLAADVMSDEGRLELGEKLKAHSFFKAAVSLMGGTYCQARFLAEQLAPLYPAVKEWPGDAAVNSLFALVSHARTGKRGALRPFLIVQVQLWMRELRRLLAKVSENDVTYAISPDLNEQQAKVYLPVVNCRDCGATGWASILDEHQGAEMRSLDAFYNLYFKADDKITMMFPHLHDGDVPGMLSARLCPNCLHLEMGSEGGTHCKSCGHETIPVLIPAAAPVSGAERNKQFVCPCCGSKRGLSLIGLRSSTEISASISQLFASHFNDDKKTLAFSDNVQDAAHRAGFFNARTWRFGLRGAIQKYVLDGGAGKSLDDFADGFLAYWHTKLSDEDFISYFIAPNMTWMRAYEEMCADRKLKSGKYARRLMDDVERRVKYEIMLEYGMTARIGRTLEKSSCSVLAFDSAAVKAVAAVVRERVINEIASFAGSTEADFERAVIGWLNLMKQRGAFNDETFKAVVEREGDMYLLSSDHRSWMPGRQSGRNTPRLLADKEPRGRERSAYDLPSTGKYLDWIELCLRSDTDFKLIDRNDFVRISFIMLEELRKANLVTLLAAPASLGYSVLGLNKHAVHISADVRQLRCDKCGSSFAVAAENAPLWTGALCPRHGCGGQMTPVAADLDYYGKLYSFGDLARINAREHTGLLERDGRERLEEDFKRGKNDHALWDPNVLSCTPTLEMGIDIGDLSTVVLCSMPPAQAQFVQRAGRAGRKDGNALTLAIANSKPHDLYFYADPLDMIAGSAQPPKVFLSASAVLERQFTAYCMDCWVKRGAKEQDIPKNVGTVLGRIDKQSNEQFPFNLINFVQNNLTWLLDTFAKLFPNNLEDGSEHSPRSELENFAKGGQVGGRSLQLKIVNAFRTLKNHRSAIDNDIKLLGEKIKELEAKPKDSSFDADIKEIKAEQSALRSVKKEINQKDVFNFLSDEGLLPNYAFPEEGVILKAVLYRQDEDEPPAEGTLAPIKSPESKRKFSKMVYEYNRSASSALSEFAPNNTFYVEGRKLKIDQIDLSTAQMRKWRLCPNCAHAELLEVGRNTACCPQCGSPAWADQGQIRSMLKVQMVYSNMDYKKSLIGDESDDRTNVFYCKQMLVDVDEDHDIVSAFRMDNDDFPFGFEFVRKATLREINFGERDVTGDKLSVSGVEDVRKGFRICKHCGKIQPDHGKSVHARYCKVLKNPQYEQDAYEDCLFLYREFQTEILRLLIPATTEDTTKVRTESFVAAFMLGMKEYFGNVDHLRAAVSEVPVPDADYRKQYLVIYDSVPGGTGYLKQLMNEKDALIDVFEKALSVLQNCSCKDDPTKDGCYHCLYAYRQSRSIGNISRVAAIGMLKSILSGKHNKEPIDRLGHISVNPILDSELEANFIAALNNLSNDKRKVEVNKALINGKEGYILKLSTPQPKEGEENKGVFWEIEPQVVVDETDGVAVKSKPDFIFRPSTFRNTHKPVAIFTDGFLYHKDIVASDTLKRDAIRRSGEFRVWSLSWQDVRSLAVKQEDYCSRVFNVQQMPLAAMFYQKTLGTGPGKALDLEKMSPLELLLQYLSLPDGETVFSAQALALARSLLSKPRALNFDEWSDKWNQIDRAVGFAQGQAVRGESILGDWAPRSQDVHLHVYGLLMRGQKSPDIVAVLNDDKDNRLDTYQKEWNGLLAFGNVMQFLPNYIAVSTTGLDHKVYDALRLRGESAPQVIAESEPSPWDDVLENLFDEDAKAFVEKLRSIGAPVPEVGFEPTDEKGRVIGMIELAWFEHKIGFLTAEEEANRAALEAAGWALLNAASEVDAETFAGGKE